MLNAGASTDPNTLRSDTGNVNPNSLFSFGGEWTPTARLAVNVRYGRFFNNNEQRGTPVGTRDVYQTSVNASSVDLGGNPFPSSSFNSAGFANIPTNLATIYDAYKRNSFTIDGSYLVGHLLGGTHTFKTGFFMQQQQNNVLTNFQGGRIDLYWGQAYQPVTSATACSAVIANNAAKYGAGTAAGQACEGQYGYFVVGTGVTNTGGTTSDSEGGLSSGRVDGGSWFDAESRRTVRPGSSAALRCKPFPNGAVRLGPERLLPASAPPMTCCTTASSKFTPVTASSTTS